MTTSPSPLFLLQDSRGNTGNNLMFWAQSGGYTSDISKALPLEEALAFRQHESRHSDVPWPLGYLEQRTHRVVDMQYVSVEEASACPDQTQFYCQSKAQGYVGNDLVFRARDGRTRFCVDLDSAQVYSADERTSSASSTDVVFWPKAYLDAKSRLAADSTRCKTGEALEATGRKLVVPKRSATNRYRCHSCNVFLKATDFYGDCPRCGADNRP